MSIFSFENKYGNTTYFDFDIENMSVKEIGIGGEIREYRFLYSNIKRYVILPDSRGYYQLEFYADNKDIELNENQKIVYRDYMCILVKANLTDSPLTLTKIIEDGEDDIRKVIYHNTPLRSELDVILDKTREINKLYQETPEDKFGVVYLTGPRKNIDDYRISINDIAIFTVYTEKQEQKLKKAGQYSEHLAKPTWINNNTLLFRIPYGTWTIGYTFRDIDINGIRSVDGPKDAQVIVNEAHKEVKLKLKMGLFSNKLIEI